MTPARCARLFATKSDKIEIFSNLMTGKSSCLNYLKQNAFLSLHSISKPSVQTGSIDPVGATSQTDLEVIPRCNTSSLQPLLADSNWETLPPLPKTFVNGAACVYEDSGQKKIFAIKERIHYLVPGVSHCWTEILVQVCSSICQH